MMFNMSNPVCEPNGPHMLTGGATCACGAIKPPVIMSVEQYDELAAAVAERDVLRAALHSLVCNADGYDKSIVRGLALHVRRTAPDGFYKDLAQRVIDAETKAGALSRCSDVHPFPEALAGRTAGGGG